MDRPTTQAPPQLTLHDTHRAGDTLDLVAYPDGTVTITIEHHAGPAQEWQVRLTPEQFAALQAWRPNA